MHPVIYGQLLVGALVLLLAVVLVARAVVGDRRHKATPFRNYFGPGYERELLRHSDLSESEDWRADRQSRFTPFRLRDPDLRDPDLDKHRIRVNSADR